MDAHFSLLPSFYFVPLLLLAAMIFSLSGSRKETFLKGLTALLGVLSVHWIKAELQEQLVSR